MNGSRVSLTPNKTPQKQVKVAEHNSWSAIAFNDGMMFIVDQFTDGSKFVIIDAGPKVGLLMIDPSWHLVPGQRYEMKITIDGKDFVDTVPVIDETTLGYEDVPSDLIAAFRDGHKAYIQVEQLFNADIQNLPDAKATVKDALRFKRTAMQRRQHQQLFRKLIYKKGASLSFDTVASEIISNI